MTHMSNSAARSPAACIPLQAPQAGAAACMRRALFSAQCLERKQNDCFSLCKRNALKRLPAAYAGAADSQPCLITAERATPPSPQHHPAAATGEAAAAAAAAARQLSRASYPSSRPKANGQEASLSPSTPYPFQAVKPCPRAAALAVLLQKEMKTAPGPAQEEQQQQTDLSRCPRQYTWMKDQDKKQRATQRAKDRERHREQKTESDTESKRQRAIQRAKNGEQHGEQYREQKIESSRESKKQRAKQGKVGSYFCDFFALAFDPAKKL
eukprot:1154520-Pelagomonas_calceolata.AAC.1